MKVTQAEIDEAVLIAKSASYKLAYELSLEAKYGNNAACCWTKMKLLWMWTNTLCCLKSEIETKATGIFTIDIIIYETVIQFKAGETNLCAPFEFVGQTLADMVDLINSYQSEYVASVYSGKEILITGSCDSNETLSFTTSQEDTEITVEGMSGGVCAGVNCLTNDKIKSLIQKIRALCSN